MSSINLSDLVLLQRQAKGQIKKIRLDQQHALTVHDNSEFTLIQQSTGKPPAGMVLRRVGHRLIIDVGSDADVFQLEDFYNTERSAWFSTNGEFVDPSILSSSSMAVPDAMISGASVETSSIGAAVVWGASAGAGAGAGGLAVLPVIGLVGLAGAGGSGSSGGAGGGGGVSPTLVSIAQNDTDGPSNGVDIKVVLASTGVVAGDIVTIVIKDSNGLTIDTFHHTVTALDITNHQFTITTHDPNATGTNPDISVGAVLTDGAFTLSATIAHAGGSASAPVTGQFTIMTGLVHDDSISGAQVFIDTNNNGVLDSGEEVVTSGTDGLFHFTSMPLGASIVAIGGIDTTTGVSNGTLTYRAYNPTGDAAHTGVDVILSPLSTLVAAIAGIQVGAGGTVDADALLAASVTAVQTLGLSIDPASLLSYDPVEAAGNQDSIGIQILTANRQIGAVLTSIGSLFAGAATASATSLQSSDAVFTGLAQAVLNATSGTLSLTSQTDLEAVITKSFEAVNALGITSGITATNPGDVSTLASIFLNVTTTLGTNTALQFGADPVAAADAANKVTAAMSFVGNTIAPELKSLGTQARTERLTGSGDAVQTDISLSSLRSGISTTTLAPYSDPNTLDNKITSDATAIANNSATIGTTVSFGDTGEYLPIQFHLPPAAATTSANTPVTITGLTGVSLYSGASHTLISPNLDGSYTVNFGDISGLTLRSTTPVAGSFTVSMSSNNTDYSGTLGYSVAPRIDHLYLGDDQSTQNGGQTNDSTPTVSGHLTGALASSEKVAIYDDGVFVGYAEVDNATHTFSYIPDAQSEGSHSYTARVVAIVDGNTFTIGGTVVGGATTSPFDIIVDTLEDIVNSVNVDYDTGFKVQTGAAVTVTINGSVLSDDQIAANFDVTTVDGYDVYTAKAGVFDGTEEIVVVTPTFDAAGNLGTPETLNLHPIDTIPPTVEITSDLDALHVGDVATFTLTFSEVPSAEALASITISQGQLGQLVATDDPLVFTVTYTPPGGIHGIRSDGVELSITGFADPAGNDGLGSITLPIDTLVPIITATVAHVNADGSTGSDGVVLEGASGQTSELDYTFTLTGDMTSDVTVYYYLTPTGGISLVRPSDFVGNGTQDMTGDNNGLPSGSVTLNADNPTATVQVFVNGDNAVGPDENFNLQFNVDSSSQNAPVVENLTNSTIVNDDVYVSASVMAVEHPLPGQAAYEFVVTRHGATDLSHTVDYAISGSGQQPADLSQLAMDLMGTITFQPGESQVIIPIITVDHPDVTALQSVELTLSHHAGSLSELSQYASSVIDYSSQYGDYVGSWSTLDLLGAPNVSYYGDSSDAWAAADADSNTIQYVTVGFETPTYATGLAITESNANGFVTRVDLIDTAGISHTVWMGTDTTPQDSIGDLTINFDRTSYLVAAAKILRQFQYGHWRMGGN